MLSRWSIYLFVYFIPSLAVVEAGIILGDGDMNKGLTIGVAAVAVLVVAVIVVLAVIR